MKILINAIQAVHNCGVVHRDLKPENIMLIFKSDVFVDLKLIDFGFAIYEDQIYQNMENLAGTINYMAPEIINGEVFGIQSDVFSLGVILYFILSSELPFYSEENELVIRKISQGDFDFNLRVFDYISDDAKDLIC